MIFVYPGRPTVTAGEELELHVGTTADRFRVSIFRLGARHELKLTTDWLAGCYRELGAPWEDWGWPPVALHIPEEWPAGVYLAVLDEAEPAAGAPPAAATGMARSEPGPAVVPGPAATPVAVPASVPDLSRGDGLALFVVRRRARSGAGRGHLGGGGAGEADGADGGRASILYKLPLFTYQAYNELGDPPGCLYTGFKVTLRRPGGGIGGLPWDGRIADAYDLSSPRQTFAHWDLPAVAWLERNGYGDAIEYCTDLDLHQDPELLGRYRLLVSCGHDEYWSRRMRDHAERFIAAGGNVAFFAGNTCWWRIHVVDGGSGLMCFKHRPGHSGGPDQWWNGKARRPENRLTGASYRFGGGWWSGRRTAAGFRVQHADHWVYAGTGLREGEVLGEEEALVGYECDGVELADPAARPVVPSGRDGTPDSFQILGAAPLGAEWQERLEGDRAVATMGLYGGKGGAGTVFNAATTDWPRVLAAGHPAVDRITRNVLDRLRRLA
jgi:hypothetical protein